MGKPHAHTAIIEIEDAVDSFCGFADPTMDAAYKTEGQGLLAYTRTPFCMMEGSNNAPLFSQCCSPRKPGDKFFPCISGSMPSGDDLPACAHPVSSASSSSVSSGTSISFKGASGSTPSSFDMSRY